MDNSIIYYLSNRNNNSKKDIMEQIKNGVYEYKINTPHNKVYFLENKVVKCKETKTIMDLEEFIDEATLYLLFHDNNIGPNVSDTWYTYEKKIKSYKGYIVTDKMDCDLMSLMKSTKDYNYLLKENIYITKKSIKELKYEIIKLHQLGYIHADLMPKNILVELKNNVITRMCITDFGLTDKRKYMANQEWMNTLLKYHKDHYPFMKQTIRDVIVYPEILDLQIFELFNIELNSSRIV